MHPTLLASFLMASPVVVAACALGIVLFSSGYGPSRTPSPRSAATPQAGPSPLGALRAPLFFKTSYSCVTDVHVAPRLCGRQRRRAPESSSLRSGRIRAIAPVGFVRRVGGSCRQSSDGARFCCRRGVQRRENRVHGRTKRRTRADGIRRGRIAGKQHRLAAAAAEILFPAIARAARFLHPRFSAKFLERG